MAIDNIQNNIAINIPQPVERTTQQQRPTTETTQETTSQQRPNVDTYVPEGSNYVPEDDSFLEAPVRRETTQATQSVQAEPVAEQSAPVTTSVQASESPAAEAPEAVEAEIAEMPTEPPEAAAAAPIDLGVTIDDVANDVMVDEDTEIEGVDEEIEAETEAELGTDTEVDTDVEVEEEELEVEDEEADVEPEEESGSSSDTGTSNDYLDMDSMRYTQLTNQFATFTQMMTALNTDKSKSSGITAEFTETFQNLLSAQSDMTVLGAYNGRMESVDSLAESAASQNTYEAPTEVEEELEAAVELANTTVEDVIT
ncbi:MAG: hypothetical protein R3Y07_05400 [Eubacteriales bacterium]